MIKIICNEEDKYKISRCINYGSCPEDSTGEGEYCENTCIYNTNNIEFEYEDDNKITVIGCENVRVCIYNSIYNYLKCGQSDGKGCDKCRFYYENTEESV